MVTDVPGQNGLGSVEMVTPAGRLLLTTMLIGFDVAGLPVMHEAKEVSRQVTRSPGAGLYVNAELFVPEFAPFIFH